uniref:Putative LAGLIDADG homing endonuclease n=1 Tax=Gloeotilopsis planctonica TaxID=34157 RepID=A0A1B2RZ15_9CHLO|nr:putative LAGLIDADG homing endonuclease [Gloeotilopsis planctonica]
MMFQIASLVRNKLKHPAKIDLYNERMLKRLTKKLSCEKTAYAFSDLTQNHWLAGFLQGDGSFVITQHKRFNKSLLESRIAVKISQKSKNLLTLIQTDFGGNIWHRQSNDCYHHSSVSFRNAEKWVQYLDKYQVIGSKLVQSQIWRKAYLLTRSGLHNTKEGVEKITIKKKKLFF